MTDLKNCPNCGAPIQDYICDYCGTIFPTNLKTFDGRKTILIAVDEKERLLLQSINITSIEEEYSLHGFYTNNEFRQYNLAEAPCISIEGYLYDDKAIMHQIQELKKILNKRL